MKLALPASLIVVSCFSLPAIAQLDSSALRAKFGQLLHRETFRMPAGFDLIVDYDAGNQVCKIEVPALMPSNETVVRVSDMKQRMYDFLADLVPAAMRGKESLRLIDLTGMISMSIIQYEHVEILEAQHRDQPAGNNDTIYLTFKNENCRELNGR